MEDAYNSGYFPPDLTLGMETGWTLTEIQGLSPMMKGMYLKFIKLKQQEEQKKINDMKKEINGKSSPEPITFVDEEEFVSRVR